MQNSVPTPSTIIAAYLERWITGRRVVVFGNSTSGLASHLLDRGARLVHVYDAELARVAEATACSSSNDVTFAPLGQSGVAIRDGAFDVGVIENLSLADSPQDLIRRLRKALAPRGVAVIATPNLDVKDALIPDERGEGPSYYDLYDLVTAQFDQVAMLGQTPFLGYAVADFSPDGEDDFSIDTAFVPGGAEEPDWYLALASHFPAEHDTFSVIQLPFAGWRQAQPPPESAPSEETERLKQRVELTEQRNTLLEKDLKSARGRAEDAETELKEAKERERRTEERAQAAEEEAKTLLRRAEENSQLPNARFVELEQQVTQLQRQLKERIAWTEKLEERSTAADARADEAESKVEELELELKTRSDREVSRPVEELQEATDKLGAARKELDSLTAQIKDLRSTVAAYEAEQRVAAAESRQLEQQLLERGTTIRRLEVESSRLQALAGQLLALYQPDEEAPPIVDGELQEKVDTLAAQIARKSADLAAAQWTIEELETRLSHH